VPKLHGLCVASAAFAGLAFIAVAALQVFVRKESLRVNVQNCEINHGFCSLTFVAVAALQVFVRKESLRVNV